jgi:hypothetical protein
MQSPARNRVTPLGDIVAIPLRGAWLGNRGILHRGHEVVRFHRSPLWIICALQHKDWRLPQWHPHHFTVLFFHDEVVALAAGHRPCALCRRAAYNEFRAAWTEGTGEATPLAWQLDRHLHGERLFRGTHRRRLHEQRWEEIPSGAFVFADDGPALVQDDAVVPWTPAGYGERRSRPRTGRVLMITPPSTARALRNGYRPQVGIG